MKKMEEAGVSSALAQPEPPSVHLQTPRPLAPPRGSVRVWCLFSSCTSQGRHACTRRCLVFSRLCLFSACAGQSRHACTRRHLVHWHLQGGAFRQRSQRLSMNACLHEPGKKAPRDRRPACVAEDRQVSFKGNT